MSAILLDGKSLALQLRNDLAKRVAAHISNGGPTPCLAAVLVGEDPASQVYVRNKQRACEKAGIDSRMVTLNADVTEDELLKLIGQLNGDAAVHGILVQLPLPAQIDAARVLDAVDPSKDVDCFHPRNVGLLSQGRPRFLPCTPHGVLQLLHHYDVSTAGRRVVILGRSDIVGKPLALMLAQRSSSVGPNVANATVTICHSRSQNLPEIARQADVLVAAIGKAGFVTSEMVKPGAAVIDVGINRTDEGLVGDVDFDAVEKVAGHLTPVPGGVGPLTIAMLLENTLTAAKP